MAEESDQERTEAPSPQRLEKAREEGQVPQSRELATFVVLMTSGSALWMMADGLGKTMSQIVRGGLQFDPAVARDSNYVMTQMSDQVLEAALALAPGPRSSCDCEQSAVPTHSRMDSRPSSVTGQCGPTAPCASGLCTIEIVANGILVSGISNRRISSVTSW